MTKLFDQERMRFRKKSDQRETSKLNEDMNNKRNVIKLRVIEEFYYFHSSLTRSYPHELDILVVDD